MLKPDNLALITLYQLIDRYFTFFLKQTLLQGYINLDAFWEQVCLVNLFDPIKY